MRHCTSMLRTTNRQRMWSSAIFLAIIHLTLLLYLAQHVRPFTPTSTKRSSLPKRSSNSIYSNLEAKTDKSNKNGDASSGDITDDLNEIKRDTTSRNNSNDNNNNTITPDVLSRKRLSPSSLPTNTVMPPMTTPAAPLIKRILSKANNSKNDRENNRKMDLMWCQSDRCQDALRERVVGDHNTIVFNGPATGQLAYRWDKKAYPIVADTDVDEDTTSSGSESKDNASNLAPAFEPPQRSKIASVLLLVKRDDDALLQIAAKKVSFKTS